MTFWLDLGIWLVLVGVLTFCYIKSLAHSRSIERAMMSIFYTITVLCIAFFVVLLS